MRGIKHQIRSPTSTLDESFSTLSVIDEMVVRGFHGVVVM